MSGFKDMVARNNFGVFLNCEEFAEKRTVKYDGATYSDIPIVLSGMKEKDRRQRGADLPGGNVCSLHLFMLQKPRLAREISVISSENR